MTEIEDQNADVDQNMRHLRDEELDAVRGGFLTEAIQSRFVPVVPLPWVKTIVQVGYSID
jgi:hypothetical protein